MTPGQTDATRCIVCRAILELEVYRERCAVRCSACQKAGLWTRDANIRRLPRDVVRPPKYAGIRSVTHTEGLRLLGPSDDVAIDGWPDEGRAA
jgi:hypothetical protein